MVSIQKIDAERATVEMFFNTDEASLKTTYCNTDACLSLMVLPLYNMWLEGDKISRLFCKTVCFPLVAGLCEGVGHRSK